jgi:curved DNA-binding protein CbpA
MTHKLYDILEVNRNASLEDIKKNYKNLNTLC